MKNNTMFKSAGNLLVILLGLALLVYSATRSLDFIGMTLPADKQVLAWFGLAALDGGLIFWLLAFMFSAKGGMQRAVAALMVLVDFLGAVSMFTLDTLLRTGQSGMIPELTSEQIFAAVLGLSIVIALNIGAGVFYHIVDPAIQKKMAQEAANDEIESQALAAVQENAPLLAAELAPLLANDWVAKTRAKYTALLGDGDEVINGSFVKSRNQIRLTRKRKPATPSPNDRQRVAGGNNRKPAPADPTGQQR